MGHAINYAVYERNVSRKAVLAEIQEEVMHEDWQEGGWYPDSQLKWHEDHVFETREDAERFLERYEGEYDDHAVLFRNTDRITLKKSAEETKLEERLNRLKAELSAIEGGGLLSRIASRLLSVVRLAEVSSKGWDFIGSLEMSVRFAVPTFAARPTVTGSPRRRKASVRPKSAWSRNDMK